MLKPPETIETDRLFLRLLVLEDSEHIFKGYAQDADVTRFLPWRPHPHIEETNDFVLRSIDSWEEGYSYPWVVICKDINELIGMIQIRIDNFRADIGYVLAKAHWGNGFATEMTTAVVNWAIRQPSIYRVWATCDVENLASARVLEKVGMQKEGLLRRYIIHPNISTEPRDCFCFSIVK